MMRLILSVTLLALCVAGITGCHASADVHPNHSTQVTPAW